MERGDYSGAVRRVMTAVEVILEHVAGEAMAKSMGKQAAESFLVRTRMRFDKRLEEYQKLTGRTLPAALIKTQPASIRAASALAAETSLVQMLAPRP